MTGQISLIVPTHQRSASLLRLLSSIEKIKDLNLLKEVLVVSNINEPFLSSESFLNKTKNIPIKVFVVNSVGVNKARNYGLKNALAEYCLLIDDDCLIEDSYYLKKVIKAHTTYPNALAIGGLYQSPQQAFAIDKAYCIAASSWQEPLNYGDSFSSRLVGGNVSYKTRVMQDNKLLFNENLFFGGTESEFHYRLMQNGYELRLLPQLLVTHFTQLDFNSFVRKAFYQARGYAQFSMDAGPSSYTHKNYHESFWVKAFNQARHLVDFEEIIHYLKLYDWTYQLSLREPDLSETTVLSKARAQQNKMNLQKSALKIKNVRQQSELRYV